MKKFYETPAAEKVTFQYQEQVTASGQTCTSQWINTGDSRCDDSEWVKSLVD